MNKKLIKIPAWTCTKICLIGCVSLIIILCNSAKIPEKKSSSTKLGLFVGLGSGKNWLFRNKKNVDNAINYAKEVNAGTLFVHVYSEDRCYFNFGRQTAGSYRRASKRAGCDLFEYFLKEAGKSGIKCYAWINAFAFSPGNHTLFKKFGDDVLTRDQYKRPFDGSVRSKGRDKYYRRDRQAWLEPGDPRVQKYILNIIKRLVNRYSLLQGIQLDFLRYPTDPPFIPGGRYMKWGYSPGYGKMSVKRFYKKHKFYPNSKTISLEKNRRYHGMEKSLLWDKWRRDVITDLVIKTRKLCSSKNMVLAASVFAFADRIYFHGFQNWRDWIRKDYVDFVILMNYSADSEMVYHITRQHVSSYPGKIWNGLGAYVMKRNPEILREQLKDTGMLQAEGAALFEYYAIKNSKPLKDVIIQSLN